MSAQVRRAALNAMALSLSAAVPGMVGRVAPVARDAFRDSEPPWIQLVPLRTRYEWTQATALAVLADHRGLFRAGRQVTALQLRVVERTAKAREPIEEAVDAVFAAGRGHLLLETGALSIMGVDTNYSAPVDIALGGSMWVEEKTNERRRYSYLDATLITEIVYVGGVGSAYTMNEIFLHVAANDLHTDPDDVITDDYQITASGPVRLP